MLASEAPPARTPVLQLEIAQEVCPHPRERESGYANPGEAVLVGYGILGEVVLAESKQAQQA